MNTKKKLYISRKFLFARSLSEAIKLEKKAPLDEIWLDEDFRKAHIEYNQPIGFKKNEN